MTRDLLRRLAETRPAAYVAPGSGAGRTLARAGVVLGVAAALAQAVIHLLNLALFDLQVVALNADVDEGAFMWASTGATFVAGVAAVALAVLAPRTRWLAAAVGASVLLLSLDDLLGLHERLSGLKTTIGPLEHASRLFWPLATMPLLAAVLVGAWLLASAAAAPARTAVRAGLAALVGAVLLEMASPLLFALGQDHGMWGYELEVAVEEGLELFGWSAVAAGLLALVVDTAVRDETRAH